MCKEFQEQYPCGHTKVSHEYCAKAKMSNLLRLGQPALSCDACVVISASGDLGETCGSTCLTQVWQCACTPSAKQVAWTCGSCGQIRSPSSPIWNFCQRNGCSELVAGNGPCANKSCLRTA